MVRSWIAVRFKVLFLGCYILSQAATAQVDTFSADSTRKNQVQSDSGYDQFHLYAFAQVAVPLGELRDAIKNGYGNVGIGIGGGILLNPLKKGKPSPLLVGVDGGYLLYGVDRIPANATHGEINSSFNIYTVGLSGRLMASQYRRFTPFVDGMFGLKIFNLRSKVYQTVNGTTTEYVLDSHNDNTMSYSAGAGFFLRTRGGRLDFGNIGFFLRFLYSWGLETRYVQRNSIYIDANNNLQYQTATTQTNMFLIQFGVQIY
jgi:hypothetical protein